MATTRENLASRQGIPALLLPLVTSTKTSSRFWGIVIILLWKQVSIIDLLAHRLSSKSLSLWKMQSFSRCRPFSQSTIYAEYIYIKCNYTTRILFMQVCLYLNCSTGLVFLDRLPPPSRSADWMACVSLESLQERVLASSSLCRPLPVVSRGTSAREI